jgi:hypothetical protein
MIAKFFGPFTGPIDPLAPGTSDVAILLASLGKRSQRAPPRWCGKCASAKPDQSHFASLLVRLREFRPADKETR